MASPRHLPVASGHKENISDGGGGTVSKCPALCKEEASSPKTKKKPASFNLRKSIAWNPAFFTEQGVLDNSELSVLTGSQLMPNRSPSSGVGAIMSPFCRSGRSANASLLKEAADNSRGKLPAKYCSADKQGRKLFSSMKTPERNQRRESTGTQNRSSARSVQKCIPRAPTGSIQNKAPNSSSIARMSRVPKKSQPSLPMVPRSTSSMTTVSNSNEKIASAKTEQVHSASRLLHTSKINFTSSGPTIEKYLVPAVTAIPEEARGSAKCKNLPLHPQISTSNSFGGPASTFAKPSALRMPSPSVGFFTQENAHVSHGEAAKNNAGRCFVGNTSSHVKPPRYKQPEDPKSGLRQPKSMSTNCIPASNLLVLPVTRESNPKTLVGSGKESLSKVITTYPAKSGNANNQKRTEVDSLLAGSGATTEPMDSEKNDAARNSMPIVCNDASHVERRDITKQIEPSESSYRPKASCSSIIEDSFSLAATCSSTKPIVGCTLSPSCISSQVSSDDLTCQSESDSGSSAAIDLENSYAGEIPLVASLSKDDSCTPGLNFFQGFGSFDQQNTECAISVNSVEYTVCADKVPCCGSSRDEKPALADNNSDFDDSLCTEAKPASSEEPNTYSGMELETNNALKETLLLHVECEHNDNSRSTVCSPMKLEAPKPCVERHHVLSVKPNMEDKMVLDSNKLTALEGASHIEKNKTLERPRTNTILKDHLKTLIPFTEEWLAVMEAHGQEILEQKTGAVQNSPPDKTAPEPSPWSPVKRKAQDVGPFDCTKFSKSVRTSGTP